MSNLRELIKKQRLYFDGGFGTLLQKMGLEVHTPPEIWNLTNPDKVTKVHKEYIDAGSNIITTNTFGINRDKYENYEEMITSAINCAEKAKEGRDGVFIALDIGPTGRMLKPLGDLAFDDAYELFSANIRVAKDKADLIIIETMNDSYETKAAVLAAKECSDLPIFVTNVYDKSGKLMTGASPQAMIAMLEGLGVDAVGMNCSFGPDAMLEIIDLFSENASVPLIANPNAGLPQVVNGETVFDINEDEFASYMVELAKRGVSILGGCCGTTPKHIRKMVECTKNIPLVPLEKKQYTVVSSYTHAVKIGDAPILIGERINPTGKPKLKEALRTGDLNYILKEGIEQADKGAHILDVNVGLPEIDEAEMMKNAVTELQSVINTPLQLDSSNPDVLEKSMRIYNGKPLVNSVNGKEESMERIFPLVKKYGGCVIALTMDESGIPKTPLKRVEIAMRIINKAAEYGIEKKDIIVDPLCLSVSSDKNSAMVTLAAVRLLKKAGIKTSLGVSNVSFGLPKREIINCSFFNSALENGLNCAIMNPHSKEMMNVYYSFRTLHGFDEGCGDYINFVSSDEEVKETVKIEEMTLEQSIISGLKESAVKAALAELKQSTPLDIINNQIVPALNKTGKSFEEKKTYLPQLLMSAEAASASFEVLKDNLPKGEESTNGAIILATVKGDIHDIGKNIVKVLLESYGFKVYDLGRDVPSQEICDCIEKTQCKFVGLSALMTTTVPAMEETIKSVHSRFPNVKVLVGGAVLTQEYADMINADKYCADAMEAVQYLKNI